MKRVCWLPEIVLLLVASFLLGVSLISQTWSTGKDISVLNEDFGVNVTFRGDFGLFRALVTARWNDSDGVVIVDGTELTSWSQRGWLTDFCGEDKPLDPKFCKMSQLAAAALVLAIVMALASTAGLLLAYFCQDRFEKCNFYTLLTTFVGLSLSIAAYVVYSAFLTLQKEYSTFDFGYSFICAIIGVGPYAVSGLFACCCRESTRQQERGPKI